MSDFSLQQILIHCKVRSEPSENNHNVVYPVVHLGAAGQLAHIDRTLRSIVTERIAQEFSLQAFGGNCTEGLLCESSKERVGRINDYFIKGQSLFWITPKGVPMVKEYGSDEWFCVE